jgi:ADP-heptose:LPS heptosyltransferase
VTRILIIKTGALGDVVNAMPLAMALRRGIPDARISWVVHPLSAPLITAHPAVDEVIVWDRREGARGLAALVRRLRAARFDVALDLGRGIKTALLALASGARRRVAFDRARSRELAWCTGGERLATPPPPPRRTGGAPRLASLRRDGEPGGHVVDQCLEFARHLGLPAAPVEFGLAPPAAARAPWPEGTGPRLAFVVGATKPANRWRTESWTELARLCVERFGARIVLAGGPGEAEVARAIAAGAGVNLTDATGKTSIGELLALLASADAAVACDTGPLHMAVALGRPAVALFGPADPVRTGPHGHPEAVVTAGVDCAPCRRRVCPLDPPNACMDGIAAAAVVSALERFVGSKKTESN